MASVLKTVPPGAARPASESTPRQQLRRDRTTAIVVLLILSALMALVFWLASLDNGTTENIHDYWHLMP